MQGALHGIKETKATMEDIVNTFLQLKIDKIDKIEERKKLQEQILGLRSELQKAGKQFEALEKNIEDAYRKDILSQYDKLTAEGKLPPIAPEDMAKLSLNDLENSIKQSSKVEAYGKNSKESVPIQQEFATEEQKEKLKELVNQNRLEKIDYKDWKNMTKERADELINQGSEQPKEQPTEQNKTIPEPEKKTSADKPTMASPQQRKQLSTLVKNGKIPEIPKDQWNSLTKEDAAGILQEAHDKGLTQKDQTEKQPQYDLATPKQKARLKELVEKGDLEKIPKENWKNMTKEDASNILQDCYDKRKPVEPATEKQMEKIKNLIDKGCLTPMKKDRFLNLSKQDAQKIIAAGMSQTKQPAGMKL